MWSYIVAASHGDLPGGSSRPLVGSPRLSGVPYRPPGRPYRPPRRLPRPLGMPSCPPAGLSRPPAGSSRPLAGSSRPLAGSSRPLAGSSRPLAGTSRPLAGPSRPLAGPSRPLAGSSRPPPGSSRPLAATGRPRRDSPMPKSQPVFRFNTGPSRLGLKPRREPTNFELGLSTSLPNSPTRHPTPPIDIRKQVRRKLEPEAPSCWRRFGNRICGALGLPIKRGPTKPTDWFLNKFSGDEVFDIDDSEEQIGASWLCCCKRSVDPTHSVHYHWLAVVSLAVLYNMVFVIGRAVFWELDKTSTSWFALDYLCDAIYLIDTAIHMHEGYLEQGIMVKDARMLRQNYMKSDWWPYDFISLIPTDIAYYWWPPGNCDFDSLPCPVIVRLNRLFRLPRMWEWFDRTETATSFPNAFRICKVVMAILVLIHWNACLFFAISYAIGFGTDNWVYNITGSRNETLAHQYIYSFYWSTLTLTTIGETPQPEIDVEYIFVVLDFLAGVLIFATIVGNIGSMISNMNVARVEFQNKMDGVKQYMAFRKVSGELEARVIRWFAYTWAESGALDEEHVLASLPDKLKAEIAIRVHLDTLREVEIFKDCEPGLLEALVLKLKLQVFSPGDYICRKGDVGKEMYIVKRGRLQVVADDGTTVLATLGAGSVFGEVSVLDIAGNRTGNRRTANVRALGYSDLFCLAKRDLWEALADYPEARATLTKRGCQLLRKDGLLDETVFESAKRTQFSLEENVRKLESTVDLLNNRLQGLLADVGQEQAKLKQRISKIECRFDSDEEFDSDDTSPELHNEMRATSCMESPSCSTQYGSTVDASHPVRERGYSLCVDRSPGLLEITPEPRSKSLRLKRKEIPN